MCVNKLSSFPRLSRASTFSQAPKTWMAGTSPAKTKKGITGANQVLAILGR
jgi:hypothetical protein